jgi:aspartyl-tRNA(Asn)/glutamyl-tRNA(Gln) amidotransferase subunit A
MNDIQALLGAPLTDQVAAFTRGEVSARALTEAHLARIEARQEVIQAFHAVDREGALATADALDAGREALGPLAGAVIALKDNLCTAGLVTSAGSRMLDGWKPPYDATVVARLRAAGAIVIGKTNQDEFAMGSTSATSAFGRPSNPWNTDHSPGGSSGGSASAVADFQAAAALGTDTGGSIRQPAAHCGLVGVKPTWGRVSRHGAIAYASSLDQIGPMTRTVADAALLLRVIAGRCERDMGTLDAPVPDYVDAASRGHAAPERTFTGLRVGVPEELMGDGNAPEVRAAIEGAIARMEALGARRVSVSLPLTKVALQTYYLVAMAEASSNLSRYDGLRYGHRAAGAHDLEGLISASRAEGFGPEVKRRILLGTFALSAGYYDAYYGRAEAVRGRIRADFAKAWASCDVLVAPTSPVTAPRHDAAPADPVAAYLMDIDTVMSNLAGEPSLSLPAGLDARGMPIGLQLMGPRLGEARLLEVAAALEAVLGRVARPAPAGPDIRRDVQGGDA